MTVEATMAGFVLNVGGEPYPLEPGWIILSHGSQAFVTAADWDYNALDDGQHHFTKRGDPRFQVSYGAEMVEVLAIEETPTGWRCGT